MLFNLTTYVNGSETQDFTVIADLFDTKLKSTFEVLDELAEIIKIGILQNLNSGLNYDGSPVASDKESTIRKKGHSNVFFDSGSLYDSIEKQKINDAEYGIFVSANRSKVAQYLQTGTSNMVSRPFFGIGGNMESKITDVLKTQLQNILQ